MVYRYNVLIDPRFRKMMILLSVVAFALVTAVFVAVSRGSIGPAIFLSIAGLYGGFRFRRILKAHRSSYLETFDDHITVRTPTGDTVQIPWSSLQYYGLAEYPDGNSYIYGYSEEDDRFFALPDSFSSLETLLSELSPHGTRKDISIRERELLSDGLKRTLTPETNDPVDDVHLSGDER